MPYDWNEFFTLAEELAQRQDEAALRTAVSRAYYAAFHEALARAERNCRGKNTGNSHQWCWDRYIYTQDDNCNQLGIDGGRLKAHRHKADYDIGQQVRRWDEFARRSVQQARSLKERLSALGPEFPDPNS